MSARNKPKSGHIPNFAPKTPRAAKHLRGFSIIELSVVLAVIALVAGSALAVGASRIEASRIQTTQERMEFIMKAMEQYVREFNNLPCPADITLAPTHGDFGAGTGTNDTTSGLFCEAENYEVLPPTGTAPAGLVVAGGVPTATLKIAPVLALDGWNRRFMYVVTQGLTYGTFDDGTGNLTGFGVDTTDGMIEIRLSDGGPAVTTEAAVLLISYGTDGYGATGGKGGALTIPETNADIDQRENAEPAAPAGPFDEIFVQKFRTQTFDDMVSFRMKWQFD